VDLLLFTKEPDLCLKAAKDEEVVVKHFRPKSQVRLAEEKKNLQYVNDETALKGQTTQLIAVSDDESALLLCPIGIQFSTSLLMLVNILLPQVLIFQNNFILIAYSQHFVEVIKIIETTHKKLKIAHCEITLSNFLLDSGNVFLNDWGCCTGYTGLLKGKFVYGPNNFLGVVS